MKKGTFISNWEEGIVKTSATLNEKTGQIVECEQVDGEGYETLLAEYFEDEDGIEHDVCPECHEYLIKGNGLCMNPDCDNN